MARSAKQRKPAKRRAGMIRTGAAALGTMISENPVLVGGSTAFLVTFFFVSANALWYQPFPHTSAFFATRAIQGFAPPQVDEPETTFNIERPPTPAPAPAPPPGDPTVKQVQGILQNLNFYTGAVDGLRGPATSKAIEAYQRKVGLPPSGEIDDRLLEQLGATPTTGAVTPQPQPAPRGQAANAAPAAAPGAPAAGDADARIVKIQAGLKAFGNDDIQLDGVVGARTSAAIREFQSLFGLPVTGKPEEGVYAKMREIGLTN
jgi:peptidoglycan hydrolase-like protein with peptidoglycan-binding domain